MNQSPPLDPPPPSPQERQRAISAFQAKIALERQAIRDELNKIAAQSPIPERLREAIRHATTAAESRRWRALLVLTTGELMGARRSSMLLAASAIECLHCATLVVDDLPCMDNASQRRGLDALHRKYGEGSALQVTVWLLGMSRTLLTRAAMDVDAKTLQDRPGHLSALSEHQQRLEDQLQFGQYLDLATRVGHVSASPAEIARLKCGRLFALSAALPALMAPPAVTEDHLGPALEAFGESLGVAYQMLDDIDDQSEQQLATDGHLAEARNSLQSAMDRLEEAERRGLPTLVLKILAGLMLERHYFDPWEICTVGALP